MVTPTSSTIVQHLWNYWNALREGEIEKEFDGAVLKSAACTAYGVVWDWGVV